jgi:hypothetical protein
LAGKTRLAAYAHLYGGVSRVEYLLDGATVATSTELPWQAEVDLSGLTGAHTLTVRAYDRQGRAGVEQTYPFNASAIRVELDGRLVDFDQPPVIIGGRALVPARAILEALGATLSWNGAT